MRLPSLTTVLFTSVALAAGLSACCPAKTVAPVPSSPEPVDMPVVTPEPTPEPVPVAPEAAPIPEGTRHSLSILRGGDVPIAVGDILTFSYEHHPSVGHHADWDLPGQDIVAFVRNDVIYNTPERLQQGMTGADGGTGTFVFKAISPGSVQLTVRTLFRGQVENTGNFNVVVR